MGVPTPNETAEEVGKNRAAALADPFSLSMSEKESYGWNVRVDKDLKLSTNVLDLMKEWTMDHNIHA